MYTIQIYPSPLCPHPTTTLTHTYTQTNTYTYIHTFINLVIYVHFPNHDSIMLQSRRHGKFFTQCYQFTPPNHHFLLHGTTERSVRPQTHVNDQCQDVGLLVFICATTHVKGGGSYQPHSTWTALTCHQADHDYNNPIEDHAVVRGETTWS